MLLLVASMIANGGLSRENLISFSGDAELSLDSSSWRLKAMSGSRFPGILRNGELKSGERSDELNASDAFSSSLREDSS